MSSVPKLRRRRPVFDERRSRLFAYRPRLVPGQAASAPFTAVVGRRIYEITIITIPRKMYYFNKRRARARSGRKCAGHVFSIVVVHQRENWHRNACTHIYFIFAPGTCARVYTVCDVLRKISTIHTRLYGIPEFKVHRAGRGACTLSTRTRDATFSRVFCNGLFYASHDVVRGVYRIRYAKRNAARIANHLPIRRPNPARTGRGLG